MSRVRALWLPAILLSLGGCSLFQPAHEPAGNAAKNGTECEWVVHRGVAELVRIEQNAAIMKLYPADFTFRVEPAQPDWQPGSEFKALIEKSSGPDCGPPKVIEIEPVFND